MSDPTTEPFVSMIDRVEAYIIRCHDDEEEWDALEAAIWFLVAIDIALQHPEWAAAVSAMEAAEWGLSPSAYRAQVGAIVKAYPVSSDDIARAAAKRAREVERLRREWKERMT